MGIGLYYKSSMQKIRSGWVVYERQNGEFVHLSEPFKAKGEAEKERKKFHERYPKAAIGVGFDRIPAR